MMMISSPSSYRMDFGSTHSPHGRSPSSHSYSSSFYLVHDWNIRNPIVSESIRNFTPDWKRMKDILKFRAFSFSFFGKSKEKRQWKETKECRNKRLWPFLFFFFFLFLFFPSVLLTQRSLAGWLDGWLLFSQKKSDSRDMMVIRASRRVFCVSSRSVRPAQDW